MSSSTLPTSSRSCPNPDQWASFVLGRLPDQAIDELSQHLESCTACAAAVDQLDDLTDPAIASLRRSVSASASHSAMIDLSPGQTIGDYLIESQIAAGGMGRVFKATHVRMKRTVALKVLTHGALASAESVERFRREVEIAAKLTHPNIAVAHDAREHNGLHYLIMEYIPGTDLSRLIKAKGPLPPEQAVQYILQAARGLDHAHRHHVVHRDIKPANLMLSDDGVIKILDMGLSRLGDGSISRVESASTDALPTNLSAEADPTSSLTSGDTVMGTAAYISPEQATDPRKADERGDLYSLGCTLFYLLTGKPPYGGSNNAQVLEAHRRAPIPSLRDQLPAIPAAIDNICQRLLAKNPAHRHRSARELIADLEAAGGRSIWRSRTAALCAAILLLMALVAIPAILLNRKPPEPVPLVVPFTPQQAAAHQQAWADHLQLPVTESNSLGMRLTLIPPGEFEFRPKTRFRVSSAYYLGTMEVTRGQYKAFVDATKYVPHSMRGSGFVHYPATGGMASRPDLHLFKLPFEQTDDHPVLFIAYHDADEFCKWLSAREKRTYRLPTEAEWEYAARGGAKTFYYFGDSAKDLPRHAWHNANSNMMTHPVGHLLPNAFGLHDIHGNAEEFCFDRGGFDAFPTGVLTDPQGHPTKEIFMVRGSSFAHSFAQSNLVARANITPTTCLWTVGFRVCLEIPR